MGGEKRTATGFTLSVVSERWYRSAVLRCNFLTISVIAVVVEIVTTGGHHIWIPVVALLIPTLGTYLAIMSSRTSVPEGDLLDRDSMRSGTIRTWARDPITRRIVQFEHMSSHTRAPNISGVLEFLGAAALGALLYWFVDPRWALVSLAGTIAYFTSINVNFYLDPSNYYPHGADYRAFSILRSFAGPIALVVALAVVLPAFSGMNAVAAGALCLSVLTVGPRVRETDANLRSAAEQVTAARQAGRADINRAVHAHLMQPVGFLYRTLEQNPDIDRRFFDDVRNINGAIREILALDLSADRDLTWPGVLVGRAEEILDERGMRTHLDVSDDPIGDTDRKVARMVFDEFLMNAVKADAEEARAALLLNEGRWVLSVTDNGTPIDADMWLRPHGGLARLQLLLRHHGGRIELLGPKTVCAAWPATKECDLL